MRIISLLYSFRGGAGGNVFGTRSGATSCRSGLRLAKGTLAIHKPKTEAKTKLVTWATVDARPGGLSARRLWKLPRQAFALESLNPARSTRRARISDPGGP